jgi:hypothetical protein
VFERGDAYAEPDGRAPAFREVRALANAPQSTGFSLFGSGKKWRFFRFVSPSGMLIYRRGPVLMTDGEAMNEQMGMMQAALDQDSLGSGQRYDWTGSGWKRIA